MQRKRPTFTHSKSSPGRPAAKPKGKEVPPTPAPAAAAPAATEDDEVQEVDEPPSKKKRQASTRETGICNWERVQMAVRVPH